MIDLDIKAFFDNIDHQLVIKALEKHSSCQWLRFHVERWLTAPIQQLDGTLIERNKGTPQGGVISPLLANLLLHYVFDHWMRRNYQSVSFERYEDDIIVHCRSQHEAERLLKAIKERLLACHLELNEQKTRIVYCGTTNTYKDFPHQSFDFLGFTFRKRLTQSKIGKRFVGFLPAISNSAKQRIRTVIKRLHIHRQIHHTVDSLAIWLNPLTRGWSNYYGNFYRSELAKPLVQIEIYIIRWIRNKFRKSTGLLGIRRAMKYLNKVCQYKPKLFIHWEYGCWKFAKQ